MEGPQAADAGVGPSTKPLRGRGGPIAAAGIARTEMSIMRLCRRKLATKTGHKGQLYERCGRRTGRMQASA